MSPYLLVKQAFRVIMLISFMNGATNSQSYNVAVSTFIMYLSSQMFTVIDTLEANPKLKSRYHRFQNVIIVMVIGLLATFLAPFQDLFHQLPIDKALSLALIKIVELVVAVTVTIFIVVFLEPHKRSAEEVQATAEIVDLTQKDLREARRERNEAHKQQSKDTFKDVRETSEQKKNNTPIQPRRKQRKRKKRK